MINSDKAGWIVPPRESPRETHRAQCYNRAAENWSNFHIKLILQIMTDHRHNYIQLCSVENSIKIGVTNKQ